MISIIMIFKSASEVSYKIDLNRSMQENVKNIVESISKDVTNYGIT
jgi:fructose-1,6-bisphosphatase/sedoheptulose 1,7-bisphosphatase-like protein